MPNLQKILWVVNYNTLSQFVSKAVAVGATAVAIRTDNDLQKAIPAFHAKNIKVYGWRWPSSLRDPAMKEARKAVGLFADGLDGYYVDPEGAPGQPYDWDRKGLDKIAEQFCSTVVAAANGKPFGTTSHYRAAATFPNIPWAVFFRHSSVLLPQAYWRSSQGTIGHGIPADNYEKSIEFWSKAGGASAKIFPMAGELGVVTGKEIEEYGATAKRLQVSDLHFYNYTTEVAASVWDAIAKL